MGSSVYAVITNNGLFGVYFDYKPAENVAIELKAVVVELPVLVDYRFDED